MDLGFGILTLSLQQSKILHYFSFFIFIYLFVSLYLDIFCQFLQTVSSSCFRFVMSPPIRASGHDKALQAALSTGILQVPTSSLEKIVQS